VSAITLHFPETSPFMTYFCYGRVLYFFLHHVHSVLVIEVYEREKKNKFETTSTQNFLHKSKIKTFRTSKKSNLNFP